MSTSRSAASFVVAVIILAGFLAVSFFGTTWLAMIAGGTIGHFANNDWLKHLGFWGYSPIWLVVVIAKAIFG